MNYKLGVSWTGLVVVLLAMLPNFFYFIFPPMNVPVATVGGTKVLDIIESVCRIGFMLLLIFLINDDKVNLRSPYFIFMLVFLLLYYILWIKYFVGGRDYQLLGQSFLFIPGPMAVFPVVYFVIASVWLGNLPAGIVTILFGIVHIIISYLSFH